MQIHQIEKVLLILGCSKIEKKSDRVISTCPFALFTHKSGRDTNPSFYIRLNTNGKPPGYCCQACHKFGTILNLVFELNKLTGVKNKELYDYIKNNNPISERKLALKVSQPYYKGTKDFEFFGSAATQKLELKQQDTTPVIKYIPEWHLKSYFKPLTKDVLNYLKGPLRKLTDKTIAVWELTWHADRRYIAIPIRDFSGQLVGITGRALDQDKKPKYLNSEEMPRNEVLFGENKATKSGTCYLVEGQFDVIWLWQCGYRNVLGVMGGHLSEYNAKKIISWYDEVVLVPDGDTAGKDAVNKWFLLLKDRIRVRIIESVKGKDPNELTKEQLVNLLGLPNNKKILTSWFTSDKNNIRSSSSLTIKDEGERQMQCSRCAQDYVISGNIRLNGHKDIVMFLSGKKILDVGIDSVCDSCVKDIERIFKQLSAIPEVEIEKTHEQIEQEIFG